MSDDYKSPEAQEAFARAQMDEAQRRGELQRVENIVLNGNADPRKHFPGVLPTLASRAPTDIRRAGVWEGVNHALRSGDVAAQKAIRIFQSVPLPSTSTSEYQTTITADAPALIRLPGEPDPDGAFESTTLADLRADAVRLFQSRYGAAERSRNFLGGPGPFEPSGPAGTAKVDATDVEWADAAARDYFARARTGTLPHGASDLPLAAVHISDEALTAVQAAIRSGEVKQYAELSLHTVVRPGLESGPPRTSIEISRWPDPAPFPEWDPSSGQARPRGAHVTRSRSVRQFVQFLKEVSDARSLHGDVANELYARQLRQILG